MHSIYRSLDANLNRSREGLRVIEDYVRFALNDAGLSGALKSIRHDFSLATQMLADRAVAHRDVAADVGTQLSTPSETSRAGERALVLANCKRLGESLRSIEEHAKLLDPIIAGRVEQIRYRFYTVERSLAQRLRPLATRFAQVRLYVLITESASGAGRDEGGGMRDEAGGRSGPLAPAIGDAIGEASSRDGERAATIERRGAPERNRPLTPALSPDYRGEGVFLPRNSENWLESARAAIAGGADCLQLREKDLDGGELLRRAKLLVELCRAHDVLCIINDRADIAVLSDADGVHVGQGDLPAREARKIVGDKLVGVSTHEVAHARAAMKDGADYIGVGPIFRSPTKPRDFVAGLAYASEVAKETAQGTLGIPAVGIAGITIENIDQVLATGLHAVAVTNAVIGAKDVEAAARAFKAKLPSPAPSPSGRGLG